MGKREIQWTEAHEWEAVIRTYELAAEMTRKARDDGKRDARAALRLAKADHLYCVEAYADALSEAGFDQARIDREVARVDALATGRLVRDTQWIVRDAGGDMVVSNEEHMRREARTAGHCVIRRRIRRRSP